jgi:hypothetical protein
MKIIRLACEQIPVPRVNEEIIGRGSKRIVIDEETLTSYFPLILLFNSLRAIKPDSSSLRQNSEIHIRLYSFPPSEPRATLLAMSNAKSISGLSPIPRSIDKLYRESIESAIDYWGIYAQKPAWYFNKKEQKFIENDSNGVFMSDNTFTLLLLTYSTASRNSGFSLCLI